MVNNSQDVRTDKYAPYIVTLRPLHQLLNVFDAKHPDVHVAALEHLNVFLEMLSCVSLCHIELIVDQVDYALDLGIVLQLLQEDKLDVFVALDAVRLLFFNVELKNADNVAFDALSIGIL